MLSLSGFLIAHQVPPRTRDGSPIFGQGFLNFAAFHKSELGQTRSPNARLCDSLLHIWLDGPFHSVS